MHLLWNEIIARGSFLSCVLALTVLESDLSNKQGANGGIVLAIEMIDGGGGGVSKGCGKYHYYNSYHKRYNIHQ